MFMLQSNWENKWLKSPPVRKNSRVYRQAIRPLMQSYTEREGLSTQPLQILFSTFALKNGTVITSSILFNFVLGLVCMETYQFVESPPVKCFNVFVQHAVEARGQGDENRNSSVAAETIKMLATFPMFTKSWIVVMILSQVN